MVEDTGKEVAPRDPIYELLGAYKTAVKNVIPEHLSAEKILRVAYMAIKRTKLRECTRESIINAVMEVSILGLDIGRTAHIIPFKREAVFIPDYKGYIDLAHRSGRIEAFTFKPVYEQDDFHYEEGTSRHIKHKPYRGADRGPLVAAYSIVFFKHGGFDFEVVEIADIEATKRFSPAVRAGKKDSPWLVKDMEWTMWCKTAVRRLAKRVPQSPEFQRAAHLEELHEAGLSQDLQYVSKTIDIEPFTGAQDLTKKIEENDKEPDPTEPDKAPEPDKEPEEVTPEMKEQVKEPEMATVVETADYDEAKFHAEWNPLQTANYATFVNTELERFKNMSPRFLKMAKAKWNRFYPGVAWPLDKEPEPEETGEEEKRNGLKDEALDSLGQELLAMPSSVVLKAKAELGITKSIASLDLAESEAMINRCKELKDAATGDQRVAMIDSIETNFDIENITTALNGRGHETLASCDLSELGMIYDDLQDMDKSQPQQQETLE